MADKNCRKCIHRNVCKEWHGKWRDNIFDLVQSIEKIRNTYKFADIREPIDDAIAGILAKDCEHYEPDNDKAVK